MIIFTNKKNKIQGNSMSLIKNGFKRIGCLFTLAFFINLNVYAQEPSVLLAAYPGWSLLASAPQGNFDTLKIPLKRLEKLLIIEAEVDGIRGNFIFDTGAPGLILNTAYFRENAVRKNRSSVGAAGSSSEVYETPVKKLQISNLYYENMIVELTELSHIENNKGVKILGLLGAALFADLNIRIDFRKNSLLLTRPPKNRKSVDKNDGGIHLNLSYLNNTFFIPMKIKGKRIQVCFDTGAEIMVLDNYLPSSIMKNVKLNKRLNLRGTGGQKLEVWSGLLSALQLETIEWNETPVIISDLQDLAEVYGKPIDAIIGYNLVEKGIIEISVRDNRFSLYLYREIENE